MEELEELIQEISGDSGVLKEWMNGFLSNVLDLCLQILIAVIIILVGRKLLNLLIRFVQRSMERFGTEITVQKFLNYAIKWGGYAVILIVVLQVVGFETTSLMAVIGSAGVALGLAMQGSLSNLAGGILILLMRPFKVGDYIIEDGSKNEGTVESIGLIYTYLLTINNEMVVIPNGNLANNSMTNLTAMEKRRLEIKIGISYDSDLKRAKDIMAEVIREHPAVLQDEEITTFVAGLEESSVTMSCRCWVPTKEYWPSKWDLTEKLKLKFDEEGIKIPFSQIVVHQPEEKD